MGKPNSNKLYHPFQELPPCVCPICHKDTLAYRQDDTIFARVDGDGMPGDFVCNTNTVFVCLNCGFTSTDYIVTDSGWRWNPFGENDYIKEINKRVAETRNVEGNPFVKPSKENKK